LVLKEALVRFTALAEPSNEGKGKESEMDEYH